MAPHLWLRAEVKANEHRTALTPEACRELLAQGFKITVERSTDPLTSRCYTDADYEASGCEIADAHSWPNAPEDAYIVGLKELPEESTPLKHTHIYFGHCYKNQGGWKELLQRFNAGNGTLLDMEFLVDENGRRVAAFGYMAGFAGSFVGLDMWCQQQITPGATMGAISSYPNEDTLLTYANNRLKEASAKAGRMPRVMVMGALGRCGTGACDLAKRAGVPEENIIRWDMAETEKGGPFEEILEADIFINCIYLSKPIPPFLRTEMLKKEGRKLSIIVDVSADTSNPHNPLPFADKSTTFDDPFFSVDGGDAPVWVSTIDHLPTLLPKESSDCYCADLLPSIKSLDKLDSEPVWQRAIKLFNEKKAAATATA